MNTKSISYAITTHNEGESVLKLLNTIQIYKRDYDEVIVLDDHSTEIITKSAITNSTKVYTRKFSNNFAEHKNYLNERCNGDYILQFDGDELPTENLIKIIPQFISAWPDVDLFWIPRENKLHEIDMELIDRWHWSVDCKNRINYPDYQGRLYKNDPRIKWTRPLHEMISGHTSQRVLPPNSGLDIIHHRHMDVQVRNNKYYDENF
jgi:glycosyltransferase involved in cell wall biosynthesis